MLPQLVQSVPSQARRHEWSASLTATCENPEQLSSDDLSLIMPDLPSGTVTFLFTDIEGSTALWERDQVAMAAAGRR